MLKKSNQKPQKNARTLTQARQGDREAFSRLVEPYRRELVAYCYKHVGALTEAEDLVQETFVRAYRAMRNFEDRATPRAWLYRIAHNLCLNHVERSRPNWESLDDDRNARTLESADDTAQPERENVRLGFVALIQSLPPRQRAALVLRDVLGWSAAEAARILETTEPAVKNALARARKTLAEQPHGGDPANVHDLAAADPEARAIVADWVDAFEKGNTARMVALLTQGKASRAVVALSNSRRPETAFATEGSLGRLNHDGPHVQSHEIDGTITEATNKRREVRSNAERQRT